ncbi:MAG TPA: hypothetical protein VFT70_07335 [Nocardioides sp.]|nr:hypothetical protein [Nocardioides sp.]
MTAALAAVAVCLVSAAAAFQTGLALGAPWGRAAYGGRAAAVDGRLPGRYRVASACTVLVLAVAGWAAVADIGFLSWTFAGLFAINTATNLAGTHPVERWGMSAVTAVLALAFATLALG